LAKGCDGLINPIKPTSRATVTNKLSDYILLGKPIINCQLDPEVLSLLNSTGAVNYRCGDVADFVRAARVVAKGAVANRCGRLFEEFDRQISYPALVRFVEAVACGLRPGASDIPASR
jgi:hypothetical protein